MKICSNHGENIPVENILAIGRSPFPLLFAAAWTAFSFFHTMWYLALRSLQATVGKKTGLDIIYRFAYPRRSRYSDSRPLNQAPIYHEHLAMVPQVGSVAFSILRVERQLLDANRWIIEFSD